MPFETPLPPGFFDVNITTATVREYGGPNPITIIRTNQRWDVQIEWQTSGFIKSWVAGNWHLTVYLESMGPGDDHALVDPNEAVIPLLPPPTDHLYKYHPDFNAGVVPAGVYKLILTITYTDPAGNPGEMAGYWEGPIIQFHSPVP